MPIFLKFPSRIPSRDNSEGTLPLGFMADISSMDPNESESERDFTLEDLLVCHAGFTSTPKKHLIESPTALEEPESATIRSPRPSVHEPT